MKHIYIFSHHPQPAGLPGSLPESLPACASLPASPPACQPAACKPASLPASRTFASQTRSTPSPKFPSPPPATASSPPPRTPQPSESIFPEQTHAAGRAWLQGRQRQRDGLDAACTEAAASLSGGELLPQQERASKFPTAAVGPAAQGRRSSAQAAPL